MPISKEEIAAHYDRLAEYAVDLNSPSEAVLYQILLLELILDELRTLNGKPT